MNPPHRSPIALAAIGCALALAACGSTATATTTTVDSEYAQGLRYSACMRAYGVPSFPDPSPGGGFPLSTSGIDFGAPAVTAALRTCASLTPGGTSRPVPIPATHEAGMVENARCIRAHGVASFPDPTFGPGGDGAGVNFPQADLDSPAFLHAAKACAHVGDLIPGVGVG